MGNISKEEAAIAVAGDKWTELPQVVARHNQIAAILVHQGAQFDADGMTLALQAFIALDQVSPIEPVVPWMTRQQMWPFV
jgi:hypothetical protein